MNVLRASLEQAVLCVDQPCFCRGGWGWGGSLALLPAPQEAQEGKLARALSSDIQYVKLS